MGIPEIALRLSLWFLLRLVLFLLPTWMQAERDGAALCGRAVALVLPLAVVVALVEIVMVRVLEQRRPRRGDPGPGPGEGAPPAGAAC